MLCIEVHKLLLFLFPYWDIIKCLNASMLTTALFELVQQFYHATEIGNEVNAVSALKLNAIKCIFVVLIS